MNERQFDALMDYIDLVVESGSHADYATQQYVGERHHQLKRLLCPEFDVKMMEASREEQFRSGVSAVERRLREELDRDKLEAYEIAHGPMCDVAVEATLRAESSPKPKYSLDDNDKEPE